MLTFEFKQDTEFSNPYYLVASKGGLRCATLVFNKGRWWVSFPENIYSFNAPALIEIANKLTELNASLRAQRWFKW